MSFDNEFDEPFDNNLEYGKTYDPSHQDGVSSDAEISQDGFDPMEITDPLSAYFFLSDDAQDEIDGSDRKRIKCRDCKHRFMGEIYDSCPKCNSIDTEEIIQGIDV